MICMNSTLVTIVIPVKNQSVELKNCLASIAQQDGLKNIEIIVVDDGSREPVYQQYIHESFPFPIRFLSQESKGVSEARNKGISQARGEYLLFIDADCEIAKESLSAFLSYIQSHPNSTAFQLKIKGHKRTLAGKMFSIRIAATFRLLSEKERIRIVNTSGFGIHRSLLDSQEPFFDPDMIRGEDTAVLARLMRLGVLPQYVESSCIIHAFNTSTTRYLLKHFIRGYHAVEARTLIQHTAPVLMRFPQKLGLIKIMCQEARKEHIPQAVVILVLLANGFEILGRIGYKIRRRFKRATAKDKFSTKQNKT